jgi:hypothetical protein
MIHHGCAEAGPYLRTRSMNVNRTVGVIKYVSATFKLQRVRVVSSQEAFYDGDR